MTLSSRRQNGGGSSLKTSQVLVGLLSLVSLVSAAPAVLGIDFGTNSIKAAIVKPGTPLDIVLTKDSKRKEAAAIAFKPSPNGPFELGSFPERLYGGDALAVAGRFPGDVYTNLKALIDYDATTSSSIVLDDYKARFPALQIETLPESSSVAFRSGAFSDKEQPWTVEELMAIQLKNIRTNAEVMTGKGSKITDAVITIPAFYNADERRTVQRAAQMAGLTVVALVSDGLAVGIDYAIKRDFPNVSAGKKAELHLIFDMGATSTTATVLRFQSRDVRDVGRYNKTVQEVAVLGVGWDRSLGGDALNGMIVDYIVGGFCKKSDVVAAGITASDVKAHGRTASKLWREAERARQVLSANTEVRSSFEGLYNDVDFSTKLTRTEFEDMAGPFADRVQGPIKQALEEAKIDIKDLSSIILFGGAIRTPFVQKQLESLAGKSVEVRSNVNSDESAAFGAAFKAASLSANFRVKEIRDSEAAVYAAGYTTNQGGKDRRQQLFIPTSLAGTPKQITFKEKSDFEFTLYQQIRKLDRPLQHIVTSNLTASVKALSDKFGCATDNITTTFIMWLSPIDGTPKVGRGSVSCVVKGSVKKAGLVDSVKGLFGGSNKNEDQETLVDDDESSTTSSTTKGSASSASTSTTKASGKTDKTQLKDKTAETKTRTEVIAVAFTSEERGRAGPSEKEVERMIERLAAFDRSDTSRILREEAFNTLEGFTYRARDLLENSDFIGASTEKAREEIKTLLSSTSEWLYGEGTTATLQVLKAKLADFKTLTNPIQKRIDEALGRPTKIKALQASLDQAKLAMSNIAAQISSAAMKASSVAANAASSATSVVEKATDGVKSATSSIKDDLDDLEEPDTESTTTSSSVKPSLSIEKPLYTEADVTSLNKAYEATASWLKEKLSEQEKLSPYEDAVLLGKDLEFKAGQLQKSVLSLLTRKARPSPPPYRKPSVSMSKPTVLKSPFGGSASLSSTSTLSSSSSTSIDVKIETDTPSLSSTIQMSMPDEASSTSIHDEL